MLPDRSDETWGNSLRFGFKQSAQLLIFSDVVTKCFHGEKKILIGLIYGAFYWTSRRNINKALVSRTHAVGRTSAPSVLRTLAANGFQIPHERCPIQTHRRPSESFRLLTSLDLRKSPPQNKLRDCSQI